MLVDSHCHLDFPALAEDLAGGLARARAAGVGSMLTIGTLLDVRAGARDRRGRPACSARSGCIRTKPRRSPCRPGAAARLHAAHPKVVGIGETGLDYYYDHSPREEQAREFPRPYRAARQSGLPLIVHTRDADEDTIGDAARGDGGMRRSPACSIATARARSWPTRRSSSASISICGIVTFKRSEELRATVREMPLERLLVETDAPYLAPVPVRGKRNEPAYVAHTAARLAALKGVAVAELERATTANFFALFAKARPPQDAA